MNYGYIRVSTEEQNLNNQKLAISENYKIDKWVEEKKSGKSILSLSKEYGVTWNTMRKFVVEGINMIAPPPLTECPRRHGHPSHRELEYFKVHNF